MLSTDVHQIIHSFRICYAQETSISWEYLFLMGFSNLASNLGSFASWWFIRIIYFVSYSKVHGTRVRKGVWSFCRISSSISDLFDSKFSQSHVFISDHLHSLHYSGILWFCFRMLSVKCKYLYCIFKAAWLFLANVYFIF